MNERTIDDQLRLLQPLVRRLVRQRLRDRPHLRGEVEQGVLLVLWQRSLPAFDATRGADLERYVKCCIKNAITDQLRRLSPADAPDELHDEPPVFDHFADADEHLADDILNYPERFFTKALARLAHALRDHGGDYSAAAAQLGISIESAYRAGHRLRTQIKLLLSRNLQPLRISA